MKTVEPGLRITTSGTEANQVTFEEARDVFEATSLVFGLAMFAESPKAVRMLIRVHKRLRMRQRRLRMKLEGKAA